MKTNFFLIFISLVMNCAFAVEELDQQSNFIEAKILQPTSDLYLTSLDQRVDEFNKERLNLVKYLSANVSDQKKRANLLNYLTKQKVYSTPAIVKSKLGYTMTIGSHSLFFSPEMAIKNEMQLNSHMIKFNSVYSFDELESRVKQILTPKTSILDYLISPVVANDGTFFHEIMGAMISMNSGIDFGKWFKSAEKMKWAKKLRSDIAENLKSCREEADSSSGSYKEEKGIKKIDSVFVSSSSSFGKLLSTMTYGDSKTTAGYKDKSTKMMEHLKGEYSKSFSNKNGAHNDCINFQSAILGDDLSSPSAIEKLKNIRAYAAQNPDGVAKEPEFSNEAAMFCNDMMELQACMNVFQDKTVRTRWANRREGIKVYEPGSGQSPFSGDTSNSSLSK